MRALSFVIVVVAVVTLGCDSSASSGPQESWVVAVGDDFFEPESVSPSPTGFVRWIWGGQRSHDLVFAGGTRVAPPVSSGVYDVNFSGVASGVYPYFCTLHSGMNGEVVVP